MSTAIILSAPSSSRPFPSQWPFPSDFVDSCPGLPVPEDFRPLLDFPLLDLLVACLYSDPTFLRLFVFHLEDVENLRRQKIKVPEVINWLEEVSLLIRGKGESTHTYEKRRHGEPFFMKRDKEGEEVEAEPNLPYHAEVFSITRTISYDPGTKQYYRYDSRTGLWNVIYDADVKKEVSFYFKHCADFFQGSIRGKVLTRRTNYFLSEFRKMVASFTYFGKKPNARFVHTQNMMVPIEPGKIAQDFSPLFFSKNRIETIYDKNAYCRRFIEQFLECAVEKEDIDLLQKWAGCALLGENVFHKMLLIAGEAKSGKSTFVKIIQQIIGSQNCIELRVKKLDDRFEIGKFLDKTLLLGLDVSDDFLNNDCSYKLKGLTGGESYMGEIKYCNEPVTIHGTFNVAVTCNANLTLQLQEDDDAWKRRLWLVNFKKLKPYKHTVDLDKVLVREEGPGILNWMLKGARQILHHVNTKQEVELTEAQEDRVDAMLDASNSLAVFIKKRVVKSADTLKSDVSTKELLDAYEEYCADKGWNPVGDREAQVEFPELMKRIHNERRRTDIKRDGKNVRGYAHVSFATEE